MLSKKSITTNEITVGTRLLVSVGNLFKRETVQVIVREKSPNGEYVKFGDGIEWFAIKSLRILDIMKV
jgi:hypothetical protein